jgi:hypothetical protein
MRSLGSFWLASLLFVQVMVCSAAEPARSFQLAPIAFEANRGQAPQKYSFLFHRDGLRAMFFANGADLALCGKSGCDEKLALTFVGAHSTPESTSTLSGHANYFLGNDPARWIRSIPLSSVIEYKELYPGISLSFYGNGQELEHDFRIAPGADPSRIALRFDGSTRIDQASDGSLEIHTANGVLTLEKPIAYQQTDRDRTPVDARFLQSGDGSIRFRVGAYDRKRPLVIDPVFVFASYLGGTGTDRIQAVTTDSNGNILLTGTTSSTDLPTAGNNGGSMGSCSPAGSCTSAFVFKIDPTGSKLIYSDYLSGTDDSARGGAIVTDNNGNAIVAGVSASANFPQAGAIPSATCNATCYFLASIKSDGSALNYAGRLNATEGNSADYFASFSYIGVDGRVAVDSSGSAYLAGVIDNANFPVTAGTLAKSAQGYPQDEMFVLKTDSTGKPVYATVVAGVASNNPSQQFTNVFIVTGIAVDAKGDVTTAGTGGTGLPGNDSQSAPQFPNNLNVENATAGFVLQINPTASSINFSAYLQGTDQVGGLAVDSGGNLWVAGTTSESTLPVSANAYQTNLYQGTSTGMYSGYIMEVNPHATAVLAATYLDGPSGSSSEESSSFSAIALDSNGNAFVGGSTSSAHFPLQNPLVNQYEVSTSIWDLIVAEMSPDLSTLKFSSFLSATQGVDAGSYFSALSVDNSNNLVVAGTTLSTAFPTTLGTFESQLPPPASQFVTTVHSFVAEISLSTPAPSVCLDRFSVGFGNVAANSSAEQTVHLTNCGNAALSIKSVVSSDPTVVVTGICSTLNAGAVCPLTLTFMPVSSATTNGTITIGDNASGSPQIILFGGQGIAPKMSAYPNPVFFGHSIVGTAAVDASVEIQDAGQASLDISNVSVTGAGFSVVNNACTQPVTSRSICFVELSFAPANAGTQTGSLTISSNDPVNPQFSVPLTGVGDSVYAVPTVTSIGAGTVQINSGTQTVQITGSNFYPQSVVQVAGVAQKTTFQSNTALEATIAASSLTSIGEQYLAVVNPSPGGGVSASATVTPYQTLVIDPAAIAFAPATGMIYAAIPASATANPNTVIPVNPATGAMGTPISVGRNPELLAASSDGSFLYVANQADYTLQRINLQTNTVERTFPYSSGNCSTCSNNVAATDLATIPGNPAEVLLAQGSWLSLYNDSGLVNSVPNPYRCCYADPDFGSIALAGNPLTVYGLPFSFGGGYFQTAGLNSAGLTYSYPTGNRSGLNNSTGATVISDGTLLYTSAGQVWNPATQTEIGTFPVTSFNVTSYPNMRALTLDTSLGEIYWIGYQNYTSPNSSLAGVISAYGIKSYAITGTLAFPQMDYPLMGNLVRWGTNGLAFIGPGAGQTDQELYLFRSRVVSPETTNPAPVLNSISPSSAFTNGAQFTLTVNGTGFLSGSVIEWNQISLTTTFINSQQLTAIVPASDLVASGAAQVAVFNPAPGGGSSVSAVFTINVPPSNPVPSLTTLSPAFTSAGASAFPLTVNGSGFVSGSTIYWEAAALSTQFVSESQLTAQVQVAQIASPGIATLTVESPAPGGGTSNALQFEVDSSGSGSGPTFGTTTVSIAPGATASYPVTLSASAKNVSVTCLNLPSGATCSYSSATGTLTITTSSSTRAGIYVITAVFTETLPGAATALLLLPILLRPRTRGGCKSKYARISLLACAGIIILIALAGNGCGGGNGGGGSTTPTSHQVTRSGSVTLSVQ